MKQLQSYCMVRVVATQRKQIGAVLLIWSFFFFQSVEHGLTHDEREIVGEAFHHFHVFLLQFHLTFMVDVAAELALVNVQSLHVHHVAKGFRNVCGHLVPFDVFQHQFCEINFFCHKMRKMSNFML